MGSHRIFVTNHLGHDLSDADRYGLVHSVIFSGKQNVFDRPHIEKRTKYKLSKFDINTDLLLMCGSNIISSYCMSFLMKWHGAAPVLMWDARRKQYKKQIWRSD